MTIYLADFAVWQQGLTVAQLSAAGFTAVNFKISHGTSTKNCHPDIVAHLAEAGRRKMQIGTFHWLVGSASGVDQAYYAYGRLVDLGLTAGTAHTVDVEEDDPAPSWQTIADYVHTLRTLLGRPIMLYTGDWWWTAPGRGWRGVTLTPYLMAAPNEGYLGSYPGDTSGAWAAGYGGWADLSVMQYAVSPVAGVNVSRAAIRDSNVWDALTGGPIVATQAYYNWDADGRPFTMCRPLDRIGAKLRAHGYTVYGIGNDDHLMADVPEDHTPFSATGWPNKSPYGVLFAVDIMPPKSGQKSKLTGEPLPSLQKLGAQLVKDREDGVPGAACVKYLNWEPQGDNTGPCYQDGWTPDRYRVNSGDRGHIHWSARSDCAKSTLSDDYDLVARAMGDDVSKKDVLDGLAEFFATSGATAEGTYSSRIGRNAWDQALPNPFSKDRPKTTAWAVLQNNAAAILAMQAQLAALVTMAQAEAGEVPPTAKENAEAIIAALDNQTANDTADALLAILGAEKARVIARILLDDNGAARSLAEINGVDVDPDND